MDMYRIHDMLENVSEAATTELSKGTESINTHEFGEVVDMIKDLSEAEKNKMESCYYKTLIEAMEESNYGEDYDEYGPLERRGYRGQPRDSRGRYMSGRRGYPMHDEMWHDDRYEDYMSGRMGYSNGAYGGGSRGMSRSGYSGNQGSSGNRGSSRYGFSHDEYMEKKSSMQANDPKRTKMIEEHMDDLYNMFKEEVQDMSPEEKQLWKTKLNRIINM